MKIVIEIDGIPYEASATLVELDANAHPVHTEPAPSEYEKTCKRCEDAGWVAD